MPLVTEIWEVSEMTKLITMVSNVHLSAPSQKMATFEYNFFFFFLIGKERSKKQREYKILIKLKILNSIMTHHQTLFLSNYKT